MAETATLPASIEPTPIPDLGIFANAPSARATPSATPISDAYPDLGVFASAPPAGTPMPMPSPEPDLGIFMDAPQRPPQAGDESQAALGETPIMSAGQMDVQGSIEGAKQLGNLYQKYGDVPALNIPEEAVKTSARIMMPNATQETNAMAQSFPEVSNLQEGAAQGVAEQLTGFTTGKNALTMGALAVAPEAKIVQVAVGLGFSIQSAKGLVQELKAASQTYGQGGPEFYKHVVNALFNAGVSTLGGLGAVHAALSKTRPPIQSKPNAVPINGSSSEIPRTTQTGQDQSLSSGGVGQSQQGVAPAGTQTEVPPNTETAATGNVEPTGVTEALAEINRRNGRAAELPTPENNGLGLSAPEPLPVSPKVQKWTGATAEAPAPIEQTSPEAPQAPQSTELSAGISMPKFDIRKASSLDKATGQRSGTLQRSTQEAETARKDLIRQVPSKARRAAISIYREAAGDPKVLSDWAAKAKTDWFKKAMADAQTLKPNEIAAAKEVGDAYDVMGQRGLANDVLGSQRENYVTHVWDVKNPAKGFGTRSLKQRFVFSKARSFSTFFEGDQAGFTPKTLDVADLLPGYIAEMNRVIADRQFAEQVKSLNGKNGKPLVIPDGARDANGNPIDKTGYTQMPEQGVFKYQSLSPEAYRRVKAMMGESGIRKFYRDNEKGAPLRVPKAILRGLDVTQAAVKREMFALISAFHQVQEGTHAVGHLVNPFFGLKEFDAAAPKVRAAMENGLMLLSDKTAGYSYLEGLASTKSLTSRGLRKLGPVGRLIADVSDGYQNYLFGSYIPRLKYATYQKILARNMGRFAEELKSGSVSESDVGMLSAEQTNAAFGHLNYTLLDRDPTFQHILQMGLLAPDFLEARGRFAAQAAKGITSKVGSEQLKAVAILAASQAATAFTLSKLTGGEWDGTHPFEFRLNGRTYTLRSVPEDLFNLFKDPRQFTSSRINPTVQTAMQSLTGHNYRGEKVTFAQTMGEYLAKYIPMAARSLPGLRDLTETSRNSPTSPIEQFAGTMGIKISRNSPISDTYKLADKYMKDQGVPSDTGAYPTSKYQQLRYALEDSDGEKVDAEYAKLRETMSAEKISKGFKESLDHPFTQSQKMDKQFRDSLSDEDQAIYDLAVEKRKDMMNRFKQIPK